MASGGEPRQHIDPWRQVSDCRDAITFVGSLPGVDKSRIGIWGSSYSGGHVLVVAAIDRRVKCVVSQVPLISGLGNTRRLIRADMIAAVRAGFDTDREEAFAIATRPGVCEISKRSQRSRNPLDSRFRLSPRCPQTI